MNATLRVLVRRLPAFIWILPSLAWWPSFTATAHAQSCDITATPAAPVANQGFSVCGPSGTGMGYTWLDATGNPVGSQRCMDFPSGLAAGTYDWTLIASQPTGVSICPFELVIAAAPPPAAPACAISIDPAGALCAGQGFTLCAPAGDGLAYAWADGAGTPLGQDRCLVVSSAAAGRWDYAVTVSQGSAQATCSASVLVSNCARLPNCPRGAGFWAQTCNRRGMATPQLTADQWQAIAAAADARSAFFEWSVTTTALTGSSLCSALNPPLPMDVRKQAKRQFAALLANVSAGALGIRTRHGEAISLDPSTPITCASPAATIGELIADADRQLAALEPQSLGQSGVGSSYEAIAACCEAINEGIGIEVNCPPPIASPTMGGILATPNPFSASTQLEYEVTSGGERVEVGVYDVSGRMVQRLASGWQPAGQYQVRWDGRNASGVAERSGVFFVRGTIGDRPIAARLLLLR